MQEIRSPQSSMRTPRLTRTRLALVGAGFAALVALVAQWHVGRSPVTLVALADPFLFNGPATVGLPVRALDAAGRTIAAQHSASARDPDVAHVDARGLRCLKEGDTQVSVRSGALETSFLLQCRPVASFGAPFGSMDLAVGGEPQPIPVTAYDSSGRIVGALRFSAHSSDTTVVAIRDGLAVPQAVGKARISVDVGGRSTYLAAEVTESIAQESVQLTAGEYRSWELEPGRYRAQFATAEGGGSSPPARWRSVNANCAYDSRSRATLHCVLEARGRVVLLADRSVAATVRIDRRER